MLHKNAKGPSLSSYFEALGSLGIHTLFTEVDLRRFARELSFGKCYCRLPFSLRQKCSSGKSSSRQDNYSKEAENSIRMVNLGRNGVVKPEPR
jgi:hypothetical protein